MNNEPGRILERAINREGGVVLGGGPVDRGQTLEPAALPSLLSVVFAVEALSARDWATLGATEAGQAAVHAVLVLAGGRRVVGIVDASASESALVGRVA